MRRRRGETRCILGGPGSLCPVLVGQLILILEPFSDRVSVALLHNLGRIDRPEEGVDVLLDLRRDLEAVHLMRASSPESTDTE